MSTQEPESTSDYGSRESDADSKTGGSTLTKLIAIIALVVVLGSPWWVTVIPQFGFTN